MSKKFKIFIVSVVLWKKPYEEPLILSSQEQHFAFLTMLHATIQFWLRNVLARVKEAFPAAISDTLPMDQLQLTSYILSILNILLFELTKYIAPCRHYSGESCSEKVAAISRELLWNVILRDLVGHVEYQCLVKKIICIGNQRNT